MIRFVVPLLLLIASLSAHSGDFEVDGCFECGSENYQLGYEIEFTFDAGGTGTGFIYFGQDDTHQYLYIKLAEEFVDTDYAGAGEYLESYGKKRDFKSIAQSDTLGTAGEMLTLSNIGANNDELGLVVDIVSLCTDTSCNNGSGYDTGGIGRAGIDPDVQKSDGETIVPVDSPHISKIGAVNTSMAYNLGLLGASFDPAAAKPEVAGWLTYFGYEFQFDIGMFGNDWITDSQDRAGKYITALGGHASPAKQELLDTTIKDGCIDGKCGGGSFAVPEPESILLLGLACFGMLMRRRIKAV